MGAINLVYIYFTLDNQMKVYIVLFSLSVTFTAISYDVFNSHIIIIIIVFVYM